MGEQVRGAPLHHPSFLWLFFWFFLLETSYSYIKLLTRLTKIQCLDGPQLREACPEEQIMRSRITGGPTSRKMENHHKIQRKRSHEPKDGSNNSRRNNHHPNSNNGSSTSSNNYNNLTWKSSCHRSKRVIIDSCPRRRVDRRRVSCTPHQRSNSRTPWFMGTAPFLRPLVRKDFGVAYGIFKTCMQIWNTLLPVLPANPWGKIKSLHSIRDISTNSLPSKDGNSLIFSMFVKE